MGGVQTGGKIKHFRARVRAKISIFNNTAKNTIKKFKKMISKKTEAV